MSSARAVIGSACLLLLSLGAGQKAIASSFTHTGTFTTDNQVYTYDFTVPTTETFTLYTTSYGGGANLNGTTSLAGGFVPVLSLFTGAGTIVAADGGSGMCNGSSAMDAKTDLCNDAYLKLALTSGSYILALTEFPNVAINNLSDGFLYASDPHATGSACGKSKGTFLETDLAPCVQRNGNYSLDVSASPVPEPPTWALMLPAAGVLFFVGRQQLS